MRHDHLVADLLDVEVLAADRLEVVDGLGAVEDGAHLGHGRCLPLALLAALVDGLVLDQRRDHLRDAPRRRTPARPRRTAAR